MFPNDCCPTSEACSCKSSDELEVLSGIQEALEERGYVHMANGRDVGRIIDELTGKIPPGSSPQFELAQKIVSDWIGPTGDAYIDHIGGHRARALINSIAIAIATR